MAWPRKWTRLPGCWSVFLGCTRRQSFCMGWAPQGQRASVAGWAASDGRRRAAGFPSQDAPAEQHMSFRCDQQTHIKHAI
eukprot:scaffold109022_cov25-Prasinocladus_malaysianus.AAC.1